jgi:hypothetical protein
MGDGVATKWVRSMASIRAWRNVSQGRDRHEGAGVACRSVLDVMVFLPGMIPGRAFVPDV